MDPPSFISAPQLAGKPAGRKAAPCGVDPVPVAVRKGLCQNDLGILEARKIVRPRTLFPGRHAERLHMSVLLWRVLPDERVSYSQQLHGFLELAAAVSKIHAGHSLANAYLRVSLAGIRCVFGMWKMTLAGACSCPPGQGAVRRQLANG